MHKKCEIYMTWDNYISYKIDNIS
uniref:Uncharacterized protein n=1 Tax=Anguilla anguilla TaxID=7936 RepID=A0A0E9ST74_ANGAN